MATIILYVQLQWHIQRKWSQNLPNQSVWTSPNVTTLSNIKINNVVFDKLMRMWIGGVGVVQLQLGSTSWTESYSYHS